jgi:hypothetical protein
MQDIFLLHSIARYDTNHRLFSPRVGFVDLQAKCCGVKSNEKPFREATSDAQTVKGYGGLLRTVLS